MYAIEFSHDGKRVASIGGEGSVGDWAVKTWEVRVPADPVRILGELAGGSLAKQQWRQYLPGEPFRETCS